MLRDIVLWLLLVIVILVVGIMWYLDVIKCKHQWKQIHDTKYDNIGFCDKYPIVLVCTKCGKVKKIK